MPFANKEPIGSFCEQSAPTGVQQAAIYRRTEPMNFRIPFLVSIMVLVATRALVAEPRATLVQQEKHFEAQITVTAKIDYLLFLPPGYEKSKQRWPLILFLHGSGESGTNLAKVKTEGLPKIVESMPDFPFILVSPQSAGRGWNSDTLNALLDDVIHKCRVDKHRIYLTGLSMGGSGTWMLAAAHPERFAAIVPHLWQWQSGGCHEARRLADLGLSWRKRRDGSGAALSGHGRGHQSCGWQR